MTAVIDTETTFFDEVMSVGIVVADCMDLTVLSTMYYVFPEQSSQPAMYSSVLYIEGQKVIHKNRAVAMEEIRKQLQDWDVTQIFAYNAGFDRSHLPELSDYVWKDIMKLASYRQYNHAIPADFPCCRTGKMKYGYGVEPVMRMLSEDPYYREVHNALCDAQDELRVMQLLGHSVETYPEI